MKTDRVDAESLLRTLQAWRCSDGHACRFVRVPDVAEEDTRRPHRELNRPTKEWVRKLAVALWRMATLGIVPEGAKLRPAMAAAG